MTLADLSALQSTAEEVAQQAVSGRLVIVSGPTGAGRWTLSTRLREALVDRVVLVRLPPFEAFDAAMHGVLQTAAATGIETLMAARDSVVPFADRAKAVAERVAETGAILIVHVPESWWLMPGPSAPSRMRRELRARELFAAWFDGTQGRGVVVLLHDKSRSLLEPAWQESKPCEFQLKAPRAQLAALENSACWGAYDRAAKRVLKAPGVENLAPIQLRLLVAVAALGGNPSEIIPTLWGGSANLFPLLDLLQHLLERSEHVELQAAVRRFLRTRFPLPRDVALRVAKCPEEHEPLLTECLAYALDGELRIPDAVRARLRAPRFSGSANADMTLAEHHRSLDGASKPPANVGKLVHWLERVHHLGHAGDLGAAEWLALLPELGPEQLLDRAWSLSAVFREFSPAAGLYGAYLDKYGDDAYAWHYLGYNLQRSGGQRGEIENAFRKALELDPCNLWWNSRLVTFLIDDLRYGAADKEWRSVVARLDPTEARIERDTAYPRHVHRWVVREWLAHGQVARARAVFGTIPERTVSRDPALLRLQEEVEDASEAEALGESVYPGHVPMAERWNEPRVLPETKQDLLLEAWMPGRVTKVEGDAVMLVVATPPPDQRRVLKMEVTMKEWREWSGSSARTDRFFEIGFYGPDRKAIEVREVRGVAAVSTLAEEEAEDLLPASVNF